MTKVKKIKPEGSSPPRKRKRVEFLEGSSSGSKMENVELVEGSSSGSKMKKVEVTLPFVPEIAESSQDVQRNSTELLQEVVVQKPVQSRFSILKIVELNEKLTHEQKEAVRSIGFGGLLHLKCTMLKHPLCKWLMERFNPVSRKLCIHGHEVLVTSKHVEKILGLPNDGFYVPLGRGEMDIEELCWEFNVYDSLIPLSKVSEKLQNCHSHGDEFKRMYCIYVIGIVLCPITEPVVQQKMLHVVKDTNAISSYNWSKFVLDSLAYGIEYGTKLQLTRVSGCFYFLMILFFEHFKPSQNIHLNHQHHHIHPCIGFWTNKEVNKRMKKYAADGGFECENAVGVVPDRFKDQEEVIGNAHSSSGLLHSRLSVIETKVDEMKEDLREMKCMMTKNLLDVTVSMNLVVEKLDKMECRWSGDQVKDANEPNLYESNNGVDKSARDNNDGSSKNVTPIVEYNPIGH